MGRSLLSITLLASSAWSERSTRSDSLPPARDSACRHAGASSIACLGAETPAPIPTPETVLMSFIAAPHSWALPDHPWSSSVRLPAGAISLPGGTRAPARASTPKHTRRVHDAVGTLCIDGAPGNAAQIGRVGSSSQTLEEQGVSTCSLQTICPPIDGVLATQVLCRSHP